MIITAVEPIMLCYKPEAAPRDGLANIPTRDVFLVKVHTDEGINGIGEGFALSSLKSTAVLVEETLAPLIIGKDPMMIEELWNLMYQQTFRYPDCRIKRNRYCIVGYLRKENRPSCLQTSWRGESFTDSLCQRWILYGRQDRGGSCA